jgi:Rps23 Pro-64 3,4-dihydroxylase Tpa1-like proline 4-hydroxylase
MNFIFDNQEIFQTPSSMHSVNIGNKHHLPKPSANLSCFQKSKFYAGIKIFNILPPCMTVLKNDEAKFKATLRKYQHTHSFYSVDEFLCV